MVYINVRRYYPQSNYCNYLLLFKLFFTKNYSNFFPVVTSHKLESEDFMALYDMRIPASEKADLYEKLRGLAGLVQECACLEVTSTPGGEVCTPDKLTQADYDQYLIKYGSSPFIRGIWLKGCFDGDGGNCPSTWRPGVVHSFEDVTKLYNALNYEKKFGDGKDKDTVISATGTVNYNVDPQSK
jgi:hypothetical protein